LLQISTVGSEEFDIMRLAGKTALITGGATGIGQAVAMAFAEQGCLVAVAGRREDKLQSAASGWTGEPKILTHTVDVADRKSVAELFRWAQETLGHVDILVNNAGINTPKRTMADMPPETWDEVMAINATGTYNCMHAVLPLMRARKDGLIINMDSISGQRASVLGGVAYCASKFAMTALGTCVALEEGGNGIRVTSICPGEVDTPLLEGRPTRVSDEHRARILQPEDVAAAALMVACLPPRAHVHELVIKPTWQDYS
jgi:NAD(P)-dependent dehydrogenase (short-subunit alcohol dehydrogenase family)